MAGEFRCNTALYFLLWFSFVSVFAVKEVDGKSIVLATERSSILQNQARRKLDDEGGSISIDCGLPEEGNYVDSETHLLYTPDSKFIDSGQNKNISTEFNSETLQKTYRNVRSFPEGKRNCYKLNPPEGRDTIYLVRASFMYGNYDGLNQLPKFDLYMGVNLWDSVGFDNASHIVIKEILNVPVKDDVYVCLENIDKGTPFISTLELRHFHNSSYRTKQGSLVLYKRFDIGSTTNEIVRYNEDSFDRMWFPYNLSECKSLSTSDTIDTLKRTEYELPSKVMSTAVTSTTSNDSLEFQFENGDLSKNFYVYMHFAEIERLQENEHREFSITVNGNLWNKSLIPQYLSSTTLSMEQPIRGTKLMFSLQKQPSSTHPPILNAIEIYIEKDVLQAPTDEEDVTAIMDIKRNYMLVKHWQGDPCAPLSSSWDGLNCSNNGYDAPRIKTLNLASSGLRGKIIPSFSKLKYLEILDLSDNSLDGPVPDFLSQLPNLKILNLSANRLSGVIPPSLKERSNNGSLSLRVEGNPDLCSMTACKAEENNSVPLLTAIFSSLAFFIILVIVISIIWRRRRNQKPANQPVRLHREVVVKPTNKQFTYSQVVAITDNFQRMIGKGGYGTVYHGTLSDKTQVAVKMLSPRSPESSKQFQTEAELLMRVHHRNLTSFLGYCNEDGYTAIVYEYMTYGNLEEFLSGSRKELSSWEQRIKIAVNAAQGLEYLHHGCKPPIIHRDIKTANILLNEKFQAKVADFGFSRFFSTENESHISTAVVGTPGYLDPEYYSSSRLTEKSDVYSFGIVLLELITGRPAIIKGHDENTHIVQWVTPFLERGDLQQIVDPRLQGDFDFGSMWKAVEAAIACVPPIAIQRPSMNYIVTELKECLEMEAAHLGQTRGTDEQMLRSNSSFLMNAFDLEDVSGPQAR